MEFLEPGTTETGSWLTTTATEVEPGLFFGEALISFTIPLSAPRTLGEFKVVKKGETPIPDECDDGVAPAAGPEHPEADSGFLCVFVGQGSVIFDAAQKTGSGDGGISTAGAVLGLFALANEKLMGTYAVTG